MKKLLILFIPILIAGGLFFGYQYVSAPISIAAIQVTSTPVAEVFLDGTSLGKTPLSNDKLKPGEHTIKLAPEGTTGLFNFEEKITLKEGILTVVDRIFKSTEAESEVSIISLEKISQNNDAEISIVSSPDGAQVKLDDQAEGLTPNVIRRVTESDHEITISKDGYNSKTLRVKTKLGYRLTISAKLSIIIAPSTRETTAGETKKDVISSATVLIKDTPTGFLRVREEASIASKEIARVNPGDSFEIVEEQEGWYKIKYEDEKEGWISSQYATKE